MSIYNVLFLWVQCYNIRQDYRHVCLHFRHFKGIFHSVTISEVSQRFSTRLSDVEFRHL